MHFIFLSLMSSLLSYMITYTLPHSSTEYGDIAKVLAHCELLFLTFGLDITCFGSNFISDFMSKYLLEPLFITLGFATTFYGSKFQDNSDLLRDDFTLNSSKLLDQASKVSFGQDISLNFKFI